MLGPFVDVPCYLSPASFTVPVLAVKELTSPSEDIRMSGLRTLGVGALWNGGEGSPKRAS